METFVVMVVGPFSLIRISESNDLSIAESHLENFLNSSDEFKQGIIQVGDELRVYIK